MVEDWFRQQREVAFLCRRANGRDDIMVGILALLQIVVTAWALAVDASERPHYAGESALMRGDNMPAVRWVKKGRGGKKEGLMSEMLMHVLR